MNNKFLDILKNNNKVEVKMKLIDELSVEIFGCLVDIHYGDKSRCIPSREEEECQKFLYDWNIFQKKRIDWNDWADIAEEGLTLLTELIDSDLVNYKSLPGYEAFMNKVSQRVKELVESGKYDNEFREWGKDD